MFFSAAVLYLCMMLAMAYTFMQRRNLNRSLSERDPDIYQFLMDKDKPPREARNDFIKFFVLGGDKNLSLSEESKVLCRRAKAGFWMSSALTLGLAAMVLAAIIKQAAI